MSSTSYENSFCKARKSEALPTLVAGAPTSCREETMKLCPPCKVPVTSVEFGRKGIGIIRGWKPLLQGALPGEPSSQSIPGASSHWRVNPESPPCGPREIPLM